VQALQHSFKSFARSFLYFAMRQTHPSAWQTTLKGIEPLMRSSFLCSVVLFFQTLSLLQQNDAWLRSNSIISSSSKHSSTQPLEPEYFNRDSKSSVFTEQLQCCPADITVVLGPRSSGKTRTLREFQQNSDYAVLFLDCRAYDVTTPDALAYALNMCLVDFLDRVDGAVLHELRTALNKSNLRSVRQLLAPALHQKLDGRAYHLVQTVAVEFFLKPKLRPSHLQNILSTLEEVFRVLTQLRHDKCTAALWPILVIDEANMLMSWSTHSPVQLKFLLGFLVQLTTSKHLAHVVLASSSCTSEEWLCEG
jgi:ATPase domain predominantly from Archaea